jgi:hypothetical protein
MKITLIFLLSAFLFNCGSNSVSTNNAPQAIYLHDTAFIPSPACDSLNIKVKKLYAQNDSLKAKLFSSNYKIEKVKFYLGIISRNPSQKKFLLGWVRRAVN